MNTKIRTRAVVVEQVASPIGTITHESFGIEFTEEFQLTRANRLKHREIKSTKWVCPYILNQLGICYDFDFLCNNVYCIIFYLGRRHISTLDTCGP